jgi:hypothetical protein
MTTDTDYSHVADWVRPGAKVGVSSWNSFRARHSFELAKVVRITPTTVRVKFPSGREESFYIRPGQSYVRGGKDYSPAYHLVQPGTEEYEKRLDEGRKRNAIHRLQTYAAEVVAEVKHVDVVNSDTLATAAKVAQALKDLGLIKDFTQ